MEKYNKDFVLPGDRLSTAEEYVPGDNTTELNGDVISLVMGSVQRDEKKLLVNVKKPKEKIVPGNGDIVYGQVTRSDNRQTIVNIAGIRKNGNILYFHAEGYIRNSMDDRRDERYFQAARIGDIIRAKVIRVGQNLELTLRGEGLGVLLTRCSRCRNYLRIKDGKLYCENCDRVEVRKTAPDYGYPIL